MIRMKNVFFILLILSMNILFNACKEESDTVFEDAFDNPPESTKPWVYWYWISDNISKEGITRDLETMAKVGIGEALIGNVVDPGNPWGKVKVLSEEWWSCVEHAIKEADRLGIKVGMFNGPGWSMSGGPWVQPEEAMRYLTSSEARVTGGKKIEIQLEQPADFFQQVSVQAFPAPKDDQGHITAAMAEIHADQPGVKAMFDGNRKTAFKADKYPVIIDIHTKEPYTARSIEFVPVESGIGANFKLQIKQGEGDYKTIARRDVARTRLDANMGGMTFGPATESFDAVTASDFRIIIDGYYGGHIGEIEISGAARLSHFVEKQLGRLSDIPQVKADTYMWNKSAEPENDELKISAGAIIDITGNVDEKGVLRWEAPEGEWIVLRTGMALTGTQNAPASPESTGYEIDKMSKAAAAKHFDAYVGEIIRRIPAEQRKGFRHVVADSYEQGSETWTEGFGELFEKEYGYSPYPWMPVLTGRIVESAERSDRFLWDLRRLVADRIAIDYVGGLHDKCEENGLRLWLENYGHWGFPAEFLNYGGASHDVGGEFWISDPSLGAVECRCASSAANTYGKPFTSAEAFTSSWSFNLTPRDMKKMGDWSWTEGINHFVLHVYIHQAYEEKPGINAWFGMDFNRHSNWFPHSGSYFDYVRRSTAILQTGKHVADVAYFIGEDAPKMTGEKNPSLPRGYDYDFINSEVLHKYADVKDGKLVLKSGMSYRLLVLPNQQTMRPEMLEKIAELVKNGLVVLGPKPLSSPSGKDYPSADNRVASLANELWGNGEHAHKYGKGMVLSNMDINEAAELLDMKPDMVMPEGFLFTHRSTGNSDAYFITNQKDDKNKGEFGFRVTGKQPELWNAVTGEKRDLYEFREENGFTYIPLEFDQSDSWFIVFRKGIEKKKNKPNFPEKTTVQTLKGDWKVKFEAANDTIESIILPELKDLTTFDDPSIKYFTGVATYSTEFEYAEEPTSPVWIDLGKVEAMAQVTINGHELPYLWRYPYSIEISDFLVKGTNRIEVDVVNTWWNRLVGDKQPNSRQHASATVCRWNAESKLLPAGLVGPVTIKKE